jgi:hypothetical protein
MAHGPCGPQFREAFSCFVYSEAEPKGIDCVEKFKNMQDCFREHPEVYAEGTLTCQRESSSTDPQHLLELKDDGEDDESEVVSTETPPTSSPPPSGGEGLELPPKEPEPVPPTEDIKYPVSPPPLPPSETPKPPPPLPPSTSPKPPSPYPRPKPRQPTITDPPSSPIGGNIPGTTVGSGSRSS